MDYFRTLVSGNKKREVANNFNLDLTYITPRLIAMAYPASGIEASYRNPINSVAHFLNTRHSHHYLIVNLSGRQYDYSKFNFQVIEYDWINHQAPPLHMLFEICLKMHNYLKKDIENVISVNCLGGKGRTGTIICCFLLLTGVCKTVEDSLAYYAKKRFVEGGGVTQPSQKRYIQYFYDIINKDIMYPYSIEINKITVSQLPSYYKGKNTLSIDLLLNYTNKIPVINEGLTYIPDNLPNVVLTPKSFCMVVCGDVSFKIASTSLIKKTTIGRVIFNTAFLSVNGSNRIRFPLDQIDPDRLVRDSSYPTGFCIDVEYTNVCNCQKDNSLMEQLCAKCCQKNEAEWQKWKVISTLVQEYKEKGSCAIFSEGKILLFGDEEDDVKMTLKEEIEGNINDSDEEEEEEEGEDEGGEEENEKKEGDEDKKHNEQENENESSKGEEINQIKEGKKKTKETHKTKQINNKKEIIYDKAHDDSSRCSIY